MVQTVDNWQVVLAIEVTAAAVGASSEDGDTSAVTVTYSVTGSQRSCANEEAAVNVTAKMNGW